jgi:hypothetical protein
VSVQETPSGAQRRAEVEAWWALVARILAFFLGALILFYQTFFEAQDRFLLISAAIGLMGPLVAASVAQVISAARGGAPYNGSGGG